MFKNHFDHLCFSILITIVPAFLSIEQKGVTMFVGKEVGKRSYNEKE